MDSLISIIMPAYNAERYVEAAIASVHEQTYANWELIVIDDGSTDKTAEIVRRLADSDTRIKYFHQSNQKVAQARNNGISLSKGELIAFLDSDDLWVPEKLELQQKVLAATGVDVIFSDGFLFQGDDSGDVIHEFRTVTGKYDGADMLDMQIVENRIPMSSAVVRRHILYEAGGFDLRPELEVCEDYNLWCRLASRGAVFYGMSEKLIRYRVHDLGTSNQQVKMLSAKITLLRHHSPACHLDERTIKSRFICLHKQLIAVLLEEGKRDEAMRRLRELSEWDQRGWKSLLYRLTVRAMPNQHERICRAWRQMRAQVDSLLDRGNASGADATALNTRRNISR